MRRHNSLLEKFAVGVAGMLAAVAPAYSGVILHTSAPQERLVPGQTYTFRVSADTTGEPGKRFVIAQWSLGLPDSLSFVSSSLPDNVNNPSQNPNDFFFDVPMMSNPGGQYNKVAPSTTQINQPGYQFGLLGNVRGANTLEGNSDISDKDLGYFTFTVNPGAVPGDYHFITSGVSLRDSTGATYSLPNHNLTIQNDSFEIVPEPSMVSMAALAVGSLVLAGISRNRRKSEK